MESEEFEEFVRQSLPALRRYARAVTGDAHAAEDLLQDTYIRVGLAWRRIRADGNPLAYARTTMIRLHISALRVLLRRRGRAQPVTDVVEDPGYGRVDDNHVLRRLLAGLAPLQRAVLVLTYLDDLDDAAIANLVQRRPATVRSLRHRALTALRAALGTAASGSDTGTAFPTSPRRSSASSPGMKAGVSTKGIR